MNTRFVGDTGSETNEMNEGGSKSITLNYHSYFQRPIFPTSFSRMFYALNHRRKEVDHGLRCSMVSIISDMNQLIIKPGE